MFLSLFTSVLVAATGGVLFWTQTSVNPPRIATIASASETSRPEDAALQCLPDDATNIQLRGVHEHTSTAGGYTHQMTYYLFDFTSEGQLEERAVMDFMGVCGITYSTAWGQTLSEHVDMDVARSLRLQSYQAIAETLGGIEELKREALAEPPHDHFSIGDALPMYAPEDIWALHQLGIFPPEDTYTVQEIEPYVPGQLTQ